MSFPLDELTELLKATSEQIAASKAPPVNLVICGGTAMNVHGFVSRATKDVDVVALLDDENRLITATPLPDSVRDARNRVAQDFGVSEDWLNDGPSELLRLGLPEGCEQRLETRSYGTHLTLHFLGRLDLICLKLYAWSDTGTPRHGNDLKALKPTSEELEFASHWVMTHNEPDGFLPLLQKSLTLLGASDVAAKLN